MMKHLGRSFILFLWSVGILTTVPHASFAQSADVLQEQIFASRLVDPSSKGIPLRMPPIPGEPATELLKRFDIEFSRLIAFFNKSLSQFGPQAAKAAKATGKGALKASVFLAKNIGTIVKLVLLIIFIIVMWKVIRKSAKTVNAGISLMKLTIAELQGGYAELKAAQEGLGEVFAAPGKAVKGVKGLFTGPSEEELEERRAQAKKQAEALAERHFGPLEPEEPSEEEKEARQEIIRKEEQEAKELKAFIESPEAQRHLKKMEEEELQVEEEELQAILTPELIEELFED